MKFFKSSHFRQTSGGSNGKDKKKAKANDAEPSGPESERTVYVHNLPPSATWQGVNDIFRQVGTVIRSDVDTSESRSRVVFATPHEAHQAVVRINNSVWNGHTLYVTNVPFTGVEQVGTFASAAPPTNDFSSSSTATSALLPGMNNFASSSSALLPGPVPSPVSILPPVGNTFSASSSAPFPGPVLTQAPAGNKFSSSAPFPNPDFHYMPPYEYRHIDSVKIRTLEQQVTNISREKFQFQELLRAHGIPRPGVRTLFPLSQQRELARQRMQAEQEELEAEVQRLQQLESQQQQQLLLEQQQLQFQQQQDQFDSAVKRLHNVVQLQQFQQQQQHQQFFQLHQQHHELLMQSQIHQQQHQQQLNQQLQQQSQGWISQSQIQQQNLSIVAQMVESLQQQQPQPPQQPAQPAQHAAQGPAQQGQQPQIPQLPPHQQPQPPQP
ncbi:hypothetical protein BCR33DRAFT_762652 [Rhizoclosmatium globosum]|uniref:RRM domain-containing protein n=1 Tax=Rhizoclosmatium globosum TaxID=329046 RepID=A0A1Y2CVA3_9FUNG|nr:hypothetical protein BCR33DRAFT_762652 [Rhizoclosmatium globosum]|eukprot:ORY50255.1 hypothetical protein BCR33DRAFT_762652 [Rhizoclosmatium globosum]